MTLTPLGGEWAPLLASVAKRPLELRALPLLVERLSRKYHGEAQDIARADELATRTLFFLPRDLHKPVAPIAELALAHALPDRPLRILILEAGVGASALGALVALEALELPVASLVVADEDEAALGIHRSLFREAKSSGLRPATDPVPTALVASIATLDLLREHGPYDLIVADNIAPNSEALASLMRGRVLAEDGALIAISAGSREPSRALQSSRAELIAKGLSVFGPCTHHGECPLLVRERDWCHQDLDVDLPDWLTDVAKKAGLRWQGLTYSYLTLRHQPRAKDTARTTVPARLVSRPLRTKGKTEAFVCGALNTLTTGSKVLQLDRATKNADEGAPILGECVRGETVALDRALAETASNERPLRLSTDDWSPEGP